MVTLSFVYQEREAGSIYSPSWLSFAYWSLLHACSGMNTCTCNHDDPLPIFSLSPLSLSLPPSLQVITRFIWSSTPMIYWISADTILSTRTQLQGAALLDPKLYSFREISQRIVKMILCSRTPNNWYVRTSQFILGYFLVYTLLGYLLHCNFYPWT